jgi:copper chaperone CopZ
MNRILILAVLLIAFSCGQSKQTKEEPAATATENNIVEVKLQVEGMHCSDCENSVAKGVNELAGIESVKASFADSVAVVRFDKTKTTQAEIAEKIEKRGYTVKGAI